MAKIDNERKQLEDRRKLRDAARREVTETRETVRRKTEELIKAAAELEGLAKEVAALDRKAEQAETTFRKQEDAVAKLVGVEVKRVARLASKS